MSQFPDYLKPVRNKNGVVFGFIKGDTYVSERMFKTHYFFKFEGYGISESILDILQNENIEKIKLIITDKNEILETNVNQFIVNGIDWTDSTFGFQEKQLILPLKYFNKKESLTKQMVVGAYK